MASARPKQGAGTRPGKRELKQQEARHRLMRAAEKLFLKRGFDATTVDEIAAAAGVSRRTFFHYFGSKEDVVFARHEAFESALLGAVSSQPPGTPLLAVAERAIMAAIGQLDPDEAIALTRLKQHTPALVARNQAKHERLERLLAASLAERLGTSAEGLRARLAAMVVVGTMRVGGELWLTEGARDEKPEQFARRVFRALWADLAEGPAASPSAAGKTRPPRLRKPAAR
ncbi:MAG: TetR family transcriptional regulator [Gemmatimonadota bacterium]